MEGLFTRHKTGSVATLLAECTVSHALFTTVFNSEVDDTSDSEIKLRIVAEKWYRESGKQKGRKYFENYYQNSDNLGFRDSSFEKKICFLNT
jgi:hypothetical protein